MKNRFRLLEMSFFRSRWSNRGLYALILVPVVYVIIFNYAPIYGVLMAFKRFIPRQGVWASPWVGLYNFRRFFSSPNFFNILRNTLVLSVYSIIAGFPFPLILAICVNHCFLHKYKKAVQTITFAPYFLSTVIVVGLVAQLLDIRTGAVNILLKGLGFKEISFMGSVPLFPHIYVWTNVWKSTGYSAVIYIASLASIDPTYHEAAIIDGANLWQRIWHIDLSGIRPIIVIMLILSMGGILSSDFERVYLMQTPLNLPASEVIATYVYKVGLGVGVGSRADYSFGTAIGLFQNAVGVLLTIGANKLANAISGEGLF
jgi:multiple sugar transport system permease protein/putative aldouronate transport system permease protein